jgi:hypothetical protein
MEQAKAPRANPRLPAAPVGSPDIGGTRYRPDGRRGHYESFFQRANHPDRPLAFWIRYTLFCPAGHAGEAMGELWAVLFDGEKNRQIAVKTETPLTDCRFDPNRLSVRIEEALLEAGNLRGSAAGGGHRIRWQLTFAGDQEPLFLLPRWQYGIGFPRAKSLVGTPLARYDGWIAVDDRRHEVEGWIGSQNHNWGERHTDHYAWGQVAGFDDRPDAFLEVATARLKLGCCWSPFLTILVLRLGEREIRMNGIVSMIRARGSFSYFVWSFRSRRGPITVEGTFSAPREAFVGLTYRNPPGGVKTCLNTKIASCEIRLTDRQAGSGRPLVLFTAHRGAFEILTDDPGHGIPLSL